MLRGPGSTIRSSRAVRSPNNGVCATPNKIPCRQIFITMVLCALSFYCGLICTFLLPSASLLSLESDLLDNKLATVAVKATEPKEETKFAVNKEKEEDTDIDSIVKKRVQHELDKLRDSTIRQARKDVDRDEKKAKREEEGHGQARTRYKGGNQRFDKRDLHFAGMARIAKDDFVQTFDYGTPMDKDRSNVLMIYNKPKSIPTDIDESKKNSIVKEDGNAIPSLDAQTATKNCATLNVVTHKPNVDCIAIVKNFENYHVQNWLRTDDGNGPLEYAGRGKIFNHFKAPDPDHVRKHWLALKNYFNSVDDIMKELRPIAERVAKDNTIIIMTCNKGQSELLMNFVCNSRSKGLDISNILVFPTDTETKELADGLGLETYFDERNFGHITEKEARFYGDKTFVAMMFAKVVCVQLISKLGFDLLFQDVDVVWYKNPLEYFHDKDSQFAGFDMYFQDDGQHSPRYAPTSANTGFYFVRNSPKTQYFFTALLYAGDLILRWKSHQQVLIQLLADHASLFGLKIKILDRDSEEFPGGYHFHRRKEVVRKILQGEGKAQIFHMSWTKNKADKLKFYQQMGEWYTDEKCIGRTMGEISTSGEDNAPLLNACCSAEAKVTCHYRDKPSIIPCNDSNSLDKDRPSFWK